MVENTSNPPDAPQNDINSPKGELISAGIMQFRTLFGRYELAKIENLQKVPVGGTMSGKHTMFVNTDFDSFDSDFLNMDQAVQSMTEKGVGAWLEQVGTTFDPKTFAQCVFFTRMLEKKYPCSDNHSTLRWQLYHSGQPVKLSDVFVQHCQECAEIALLAYHCLRERKVNAAYICGDALWKEDDEIPEPHGFVLIGEEYVFDAANPTTTDQGQFPSIYKLATNFRKEMQGQNKKLIEGKNILSGATAFFGVSDGASIFKNQLVTLE